MRIEREKTIALIVGTCLAFTLCMVSFVTTVEAAGFIYVDAPTGDPTLDHAAIQGALDATKPGGTVVLASGCYKISKSIVSIGFHGTIVGAGMDQTVIEAVSGPLEYFEAAYNPVFDDSSGEGSKDYYTAFFLFGSPEKKLAVSDLSLKVKDEIVVEMSYTTFPDGSISYWDWVGEKLAGGLEVDLAFGCDTSFENIRLTGLPGLGANGNPRNGITYWLCDGGKHTLDGCILENIGTFSWGPYACYNGKYVAEKNEFLNGWRGTQITTSTNLNVRISENSFLNMGDAAVSHYGPSSSHIIISDNTFQDCEGSIWAYTWPGYPTVGSNYIIKDNVIDAPDYSWYGGIELWDESDVKSHFVITHNTVHQDGFIAPYCGISLNGVYDSVVANNKITGSGPAAIFVGTFADWDEVVNVRIINNNVKGFDLVGSYWHDAETGGFSWLDPKGHIYLGDDSYYCIVVPGSSSDIVYDVGTGNLVVER